MNSDVEMDTIMEDDSKTKDVDKIVNTKKKYLDMKTYEEDKMEWMQDVKTDSEEKSPINFSAR